MKSFNSDSISHKLTHMHHGAINYIFCQLITDILVYSGPKILTYNFNHASYETSFHLTNEACLT